MGLHFQFSDGQWQTMPTQTSILRIIHTIPFREDDRETDCKFNTTIKEVLFDFEVSEVRWADIETQKDCLFEAFLASFNPEFDTMIDVELA